MEHNMFCLQHGQDEQDIKDFRIPCSCDELAEQSFYLRKEIGKRMSVLAVNIGASNNLSSDPESIGAYHALEWVRSML